MTKSVRMMLKQGALMSLTVFAVGGLVMFLSTGLKISLFVVVLIVFLAFMGL